MLKLVDPHPMSVGTIRGLLAWLTLGVPLAIWVFLVLMRRDVRDSFD